MNTVLSALLTCSCASEEERGMSAALENGLTVTALHNHFFFDEPMVFFMHIGGEGTPAA